MSLKTKSNSRLLTVNRVANNEIVILIGQAHFNDAFTAFCRSLHFEFGNEPIFRMFPSNQRRDHSSAARHGEFNFGIDSLDGHVHATDVKSMTNEKNEHFRVTEILLIADARHGEDTYFPSAFSRKSALFLLPRCVNGICNAFGIDFFRIAWSKPWGAISIVSAFGGR